MTWHNRSEHVHERIHDRQTDGRTDGQTRARTRRHCQDQYRHRKTRGYSFLLVWTGTCETFRPRTPLQTHTHGICFSRKKTSGQIVICKSPHRPRAVSTLNESCIPMPARAIFRDVFPLVEESRRSVRHSFAQTDHATSHLKYSCLSTESSVCPGVDPGICLKGAGTSSLPSLLIRRPRGGGTAGLAPCKSTSAVCW